MGLKKGSQMRQIILLIFLLPAAVFASTFECSAVEGVYQPPGQSTLEDAGGRDQSVIGRVFHVKRESGEIVGSGLFASEDETITILRDVNEIINTFEVMYTNKHSDLKFLKISEFEGDLTFSFYFGWLRLLLIGKCRVV